MNNNINKNIQRRRRFKYGAFAVALTAAVIALVVIVNIVFSALAQKNMWYIDMTERDLYTPDAGAVTLLEEFEGKEDFSIKFIFCVPEDQLSSNQEVNMIHNLIKRYQTLFSFIEIECVDILHNPQILDKYQFTSVSSPKSTSVIVANGNNAILYTLDSFFYTNDSDGSYNFQGDYTIASAILRLSGENPIAYFVTNHNENVEGSAMKQLFIDAGYDVKSIDLSKETPDYENGKVIVINNPSYDFMGPDDSVNEIAKLTTFMKNVGGIMVFMDETVNPTPNLDSFLAEWGVKFENSYIRDYENSLAGSSGIQIVSEYSSVGWGGSLTKDIRSLQNPPKTIVTKCRPITCLYDDETGKHFSGEGTRYCSPVLTTSSSKTAVSKPIGVENAEGKNGVFNVMTVTVSERYKDNVPQYSYVLAAGTSAFSNDKYISGSSYGNRDVIFSAMKQFARKQVPVEILPKVFSDTGLILTTAEANRWTVICTVLLPAIVSGVGIYVYTRRRYK